MCDTARAEAGCVSGGASLARVLREAEAMVAGSTEAAGKQLRRMQSLELDLAALRHQMASAASGARVYLLYWCKSTNTGDAPLAVSGVPACGCWVVC
jgi:hypothetical protein